jgi:hypothetical protein
MNHDPGAYMAWAGDRKGISFWGFGPADDGGGSGGGDLGEGSADSGRSRELFNNYGGSKANEEASPRRWLFFPPSFFLIVTIRGDDIHSSAKTHS